MKQKTLIKSALLISIVSATESEYDPQAVPIAQLWGPDAQPKNCFELQPAYGSIEDGQVVSDLPELQNIDIISLDHEIVSFKRCFPYNESKLQSLALYLQIAEEKVFNTVTGEPKDPEELKRLTYETSLLKIGFEYGDCVQENVSGPISWFEIQYTQVNGVQKVSFKDAEKVWEFGYEIEGQAKVTKKFEFGPTKRWIGVHGVESTTGIEKLGIITMDPTCKPVDGELLI